jgi:uncharacterized membrane protein YhaH (DUF805 family)
VSSVKWYWWLLVAIFAVLGICTLVPVPAGESGLLGYHFLCPLAPVSTIICWIIAGVCCWLGRKRAAKEAAAPKGEATAKGGA